MSGLTSLEAAARLTRDGPNAMPPPRRRSAVRRFADQLFHFFALMLWVAVVLSWIGGLPQLSIAVSIVIVLNAVFAFAQETRAGRAAERLQAMLPRKVTVVRDGAQVSVDAAEVVVGDLVVLEAGDRVPADAAVVAADGLLINTSMLTGESEPTFVDVGADLFAGTFVVEGDGRATVTATGGRTRLAAISQLTTATAAPASPLTLEIHRVVRMVAAIAVGVGAAFFAVSLLLGNPASDGLVFAIGVTVALVPEALLPTVTLSLAWGAEQMAHRQVLVRNLDAVETLGSTTFICTDKTGTLTCNLMTVVQAWTPAGGAIVGDSGYDPAAPVVLTDPRAREALTRLATTAARTSDGFTSLVDGAWVPHGDPMEVAIDVFARRLGSDTDIDRSQQPRAAHFPFDPRRRRMSVVTDGKVLVKGAPDSLLGLCEPVTGADAALEAFTSRGLRVIAVAGRSCTDLPRTAAEAETRLELYGLLALQDPPRPDVGDAIAACRTAGIRVGMVTGDHPATAAAIASEVGLRDDEGLVLTGEDLPDDDQVLGALIDRDGIVIARVSPEDKLRIARALRARGHVVAMTGDGVNDGPALHEADIGIAMGASGTDVAREAADLVLLNDDFASIVAGIEQGRATYLNVRRFLTYHLTDNVAELTPFLVWALSGGRFPLALGVLQILALDIGTDTFSAVALGAEPPPSNALTGPPVSGHLMSRTVLRRSFGILGPTEAAMSMAAFVGTFLAAGWRAGDPFPEGHVLATASGAAFIAVVFGQMANAFAGRSSTRPPWRLGWTTNRLLVPAVVLAALVSGLALGIGPVARSLDQALPSIVGWTIAAACAPAVLAVDAIAKRLMHRSSGTAA